MFLQQLITGLSVGSIYALMAVGYSLIYSLLNFTNFAHGASVLIGAYVGYFYISSVADNVLMAVVCSTFFGAVLAALIERIAYQPLLNKGVKRIYLLIAGLGISIIGENLIVVMIDGRFHAYKTSLSAMPVSILGASIGVVDLIILVASAIALLSVQFLIRKTRVGLAIRGAAFDLTTASIMEASNPVPTPLLGHRCRSSQEITGSPTPFSTSNHYLWICESASFSLSNPNIAA